MILQTTHKLTRNCNITEYDFANKSMSFVLELILSVVCLSLLNKQKKWFVRMKYQAGPITLLADS